MAKKKETVNPEAEEPKPLDLDLVDLDMDASLEDRPVIPISADEVAAEVAADEEAEEVETVEEPVGRRVSGKKRSSGKKEQPQEQEEEQQTSASSAPARSSKERQRDEAQRQAARNSRQEDVMTVAKYLGAERRNNVLSGKIAGVEVRGNHAFWIIYDGPVIVMIPFHEAFGQLSGNLEKITQDELTSQCQLLSKSIGAEVPFSVEQMVEDGDVFLVYGSRQVALGRIRNRYFGPKAPHPVQEGDDLMGTFLSVGRHAAWINVNGLDVRLSKNQLSHRYIENLMDVYKPGDEILLRVQELTMKDGKPEMVMSALPCELEVCKTRLGRIRSGNRYIATITTHRLTNGTDPRTGQRRKYYVASMWLEGAEVAAYATLPSAHLSQNETKYVHSGGQVSVAVDQISRNGYVRCKIISYLP